MKPFEEIADNLPEIPDDEVLRSILSVPTHFGISEFTEQLTQSLAVLVQKPSSNLAAGTYYPVFPQASNNSLNQGVDMSVIRRLITYLDVGVAGANANIQLYYIASANANMAGNVNVASSIPLTTATNKSNVVESLEVRADQLPSGTRYCLPVLVVNTATSQVGLISLGSAASYHPASQYNSTNVLDQAVVT